MMDRSRAISLVVAAAFFMEYFDSTVIATALPAMGRDFGRDPVTLGIGITVYLLALAVFIPLSGWVADRFGTRTVFLNALVGFTAASFLCALCTSLWPFVGARLLQGTAGAMMVPVGRLLVLRTTEKANLVAAIALLTWPALGAPAMAPLVGGLLTTYASWRWIFLINVPIGLVVLILARMIMPNLHSADRRPFDLPGFLLSGSALALFMEGLELISQNGAPWPVGLACTAMGLLLGWAAVWHAQRTSKPMLDLSTMRIKTFRTVILSGSVFRVTIGAAPFLLPLLFQIGFGMDAFHSGVLVFVTFLGNMLMKVATTQIIRRWGFRTTGIVTGLGAALALLACSGLTPSTPIVIMVVVLFAGGLLRSMQFSVLNTLSFADVPHPRMSAASALTSVAQQMATGVGVAVGAIAVHVAAAWHGTVTPTLADFHLAFLLTAVLTLVGIPGFFFLPRDAGAMVSGHQVKVS
jgi:EmrB/QacA subfamily drug resistance transporter